ncbi:MAG: TonB-dependent receptor [Raineya sp.]
MKKITLIICLIHSLSGFSQIIKGKITTLKGEKIASANVIVRDTVGAEDFLEFVLSRNGEYELRLQKNYKYFVLEAVAMGYNKEYFELGNLDPKQTYYRDFVLVKEEEQIEEIVISAERPPITTKGDTTIFQVKSFSDGTEKKIEEIIKKLPGVQVNEQTGEIRYKNRSIETIKLDGDDLFGANYAIGSRNINVGVVKEIEAIENYSANPLLKGIENSDKVILNLKLEKNINLSGDISLGQGLMGKRQFARDVASTLLAVGKPFKAFFTLSYNNVGINRSPFNYFNSQNYNPRAMKEKNYLTHKFIQEYGFSSVLDEKRVRINNTAFSSYNQAFGIGKKTRGKSGLYFIYDKITSLQRSINDMQFNNERLLTSDNNTISKQPIQYSGDVELQTNLSPKSLLEYKIMGKYENIQTSSDLLQNQSNHFQTQLRTKDYYFKQAATFTKKISEQKAIQVFVVQAHNQILQNFLLEPAFVEPTLSKSEEQITQTTQNVVETKATMLASTSKNKYTISVGGASKTNPVFSTLKGYDSLGNSSSVSGFENQFTYQQHRVFNYATYLRRYEKWSFSFANATSFLYQKLHNSLSEARQSKNSFIVEPSCNVFYRLTNQSSFKLSYAYTQEPFMEEYLFSNFMLNSVRQSTRNIPQLEFAKKHAGRLIYQLSINELFLYYFSGNYSISKGNYFADMNIESNRTQITYFYSPQNITNASFQASFDGFFYQLHLLSKANLGYGISNYSNFVNSLTPRENQLKNFFMNFELKTGFNTKINFANVFNYSNSVASSAGLSSFRNSNFSNAFLALFKQNKTDFLSITFDIFVPNGQKIQENYKFLDVQYRFRLANFDIDIICKNIFNKNNFEQITTTDFGVFLFRSNLLPRYGMLKISCNL